MQCDQHPEFVTQNFSGKTYYYAELDLILIFGLTELQGQVRWFKDVGVPINFVSNSPTDMFCREWSTGKPILTSICHALQLSSYDNPGARHN